MLNLSVGEVVLLKGFTGSVQRCIIKRLSVLGLHKGYSVDILYETTNIRSIIAGDELINNATKLDGSPIKKIT